MHQYAGGEKTGFFLAPAGLNKNEMLSKSRLGVKKSPESFPARSGNLSICDKRTPE